MHSNLQGTEVPSGESLCDVWKDGSHKLLTNHELCDLPPKTSSG